MTISITDASEKKPSFSPSAQPGLNLKRILSHSLKRKFEAKLSKRIRSVASAAWQGNPRPQNEAAERLRERRHLAGALSLETTELQPVLPPEGRVIDLDARRPNQASLMIEDLMVAANQVTASLLEQKNVPSIRRVLKDPERWDRIAILASTLSGNLPSEPNAKSLEGFLNEHRRVNPDHFPDLSLSIMKLLGRGEYVLKSPGTASPGHFGLAVQHYSHSTAPSRRYPDLLTQRLLKGALAGKAAVYGVRELESLAERCTQKEDDANKVERLVRKCIAAMVTRSHIGEKFTVIVTGASDKGTWVRVSAPPENLMAQSKILKSVTQSRFSCVRLTLTGASLIFDFRETPDC